MCQHHEKAACIRMMYEISNGAENTGSASFDAFSIRWPFHALRFHSNRIRSFAAGVASPHRVAIPPSSFAKGDRTEKGSKSKRGKSQGRIGGVYLYPEEYGRKFVRARLRKCTRPGISVTTSRHPESCETLSNAFDSDVSSTLHCTCVLSN